MGKVRVQIISIGDELLLGETLNTNASFIAKSLQKIGLSVIKILTIADDPQQMKEVITTATKEADLILTTGGLGPTNDDLTQKVFCELTEDVLIEDAEVLKELIIRHEIRGKKDSWEVNKLQAFVPSKAKVFVNKNGTAPALWMEYNRAVCVAMPGVPFEMKALLTEQINPYILKNFAVEPIFYQTVLTYGIGESVLMQRLKEWEENLPEEVKLSYLPSYGKVRLRLLGKGKNKHNLEKTINTFTEELKNLLPDVIVGIEGEIDIVDQIRMKLEAKKATLSIAESCTGGLLSNSITEKSGISSFYIGGVITYATQSKVKLLGVSKSDIDKYSVVSAEVASAMARGVSQLYHTDYALATTGEAGPNKGDSDADIGTVYIALKTPEKTHIIKGNYGNRRETIMKRAVKEALVLLWKEI